MTWLSGFPLNLQICGHLLILMPRELVTVLGKASEDYIRRQLGEDSFRPVMCMLFLYRIMDQVLLLLKIRVGGKARFVRLASSHQVAISGRKTCRPRARIMVRLWMRS